MLTSCRKYKLKLKWYNLLHRTSTLHCQPEKKEEEEEETMSTRNLCRLSTSFHSQGEVAPTSVKGREKTQSPRATVSSQGHCCLAVLTAAETIGLLLQESFIKYQE